LHVLHIGYVDERGVGATVSLVLDGDARIVVDPGMVADREQIIGPLRGHGLAPTDVTHVFPTHHHDDQSALDASRARVLALADIVVPGHGPPFRVAGGSVS